MALVRDGFPVLMFAQDDETRAGVEAARRGVRGARRQGAAGRRACARRDHCCPPSSPIRCIEPMLPIQSFYAMANHLSLARGLDPDRPPHLHKVTETV